MKQSRIKNAFLSICFAVVICLGAIVLEDALGKILINFIDTQLQSGWMFKCIGFYIILENSFDLMHDFLNKKT